MCWKFRSRTMDDESTKRSLRTTAPFLNVSDAGVPVVVVFYEERFRIPAEEQSAGRVVDYFYRVEFQERGSLHIHSTPHNTHTKENA